MERENGSDEMILVPRAELLAWAQDWLRENDPGDGTDCVTPFDRHLLKTPVKAHCATCSCEPGMTPAIRFDTTPAEKEGAVRDHLVRMGWTPPAEAQAQGGGEVVAEVVLHNNLLYGRLSRDLPVGAKLYTAPPSAPVGVEDESVRVGNLPTMNQDGYPGLGEWWVQLWRGDEIIARVYGDGPDEVRSQAQDIADALNQQPAAVDGDNPYPAPRNRQEAAALAKLALAYLGVTSAHIDAAVARCETDLAGQQGGPQE